MQIKSQTNNSNNNFTSIVPLNVYIDGKAVTSKATLEKSVRKISAVLFENKETQDTFRKNGAYFDPMEIGITKSKMIRSCVSEIENNTSCAFLFTGKHAKLLDALGQAIGKAIKHFPNSVETCRKRYGEKLSEFLFAEKTARERTNPLEVYLLTDKKTGKLVFSKLEQQKEKTYPQLKYPPLNAENNPQLKLIFK